MGEQRDFGDETESAPREESGLPDLNVLLVPGTGVFSLDPRDPRLDPAVKYKLSPEDERFLHGLRIKAE